MISGSVTGDAEVVTYLDRVASRLGPETRIGITRLTLHLQRKVKRDKLSGQVLNVRTGRLRRSVGQDVHDEGDKIVGTVSTPVEYAPPNEYGFTGTQSVRTHLRTITQAFGRPIPATEVEVSAHSRAVNLPERSFLRSSLREMAAAGEITDEMEAVVKRARA